MSEFDDLDKPGFFYDPVYVTAGPKALYGERRFSVTCEGCKGVTVEDSLTEAEADVAESLHRGTCPNVGKAARWVT